MRYPAAMLVWPWVVPVLVFATLLMRFAMLGERPVMHDESMFAYYAYLGFERGSYTHMPILHGPALMLAVGELFALFGDSIEVARAFVALASLAMLAAVLAMVPGRYRIWFAPMLLTSPMLLYYSRFLRNDIIFCAVLMLGMVGFSVAMSRRRSPGARAAGALLGVFMWVALTGIMENAAFVYATGLTFLLVAAGARGVMRAAGAMRPALPAPRAGRWIVVSGWLGGLLLGLGFLALVYGVTLAQPFRDRALLSALGDNPDIVRAVTRKERELTWAEQAGFVIRLMPDSWRNVRDSWDYWKGQHVAHRISGPTHYHLPILLTYELPMCLLLLAGLIRDACLRKRRAWVYVAACGLWAGIWALWWLAGTANSPLWLVELENFLHIAPDGSALTLGLIITPVLVWSFLCIRERRMLAAWMGWWLACSVFQYSVAGEKVPWLGVHIVLPLYLTVAWVWAPRLRRMGKGAKGLAAAIVIATSLIALRNDVALIGSRSADPAERILYNHTTPWMHEALMARVALWQSMAGEVPLMQHRVLLVGAGIWPGVWYLRHFGYQLVDGNRPIESLNEKYDLIVGTPESLAPLRERDKDGRFRVLAGSMRDSWIETWPDSERWAARSMAAGNAPLPPDLEYGALLRSSLVKLWRYYWFREPWTPRPGGYPIWLMEPK